MCFSVLVVLGQQPLQRLARLLKTLSHKIAVGQKKLSWLRGWIAVQDAPRAPFGIGESARVYIGARELNRRFFSFGAKYKRSAKEIDGPSILLFVCHLLALSRAHCCLLAAPRKVEVLWCWLRP